MTRLFSTFGLGILFVTISPNLRGTVWSAVDASLQWMTVNGPGSYIGLGFVTLAGMMFGLHRASQPRI